MTAIFELQYRSWGRGTEQLREKFQLCVDRGVAAQRTKVRLVKLSTTVPTRQANNLKVYRVKR